MKTDRLSAAMRAVVCSALLALFAIPAAHATDNNFPTPGGATADGKVVMCVNGSNQAVPCGTASTPMQVAGTFSSSVGGFTPGLTFATLTATAASASVALPAGTVVFFQNNGTTTVSCTLGVGSATATANEILVPASSGVPLVVGSNTFGACIDQSGTASNLVVLAGGSGLGTPFGGGGGGGGGGGAVTMASGAVASGAYSAGSLASGAGVDGWDLTQGAKADAACAGDNTSGCSVEARLQRIAQNITTLNTTAGNPVAAQSNHTTNIGSVDIGQSTDGTTNGVRLTSQYPAGATAVQGSATGTTAATSTTLAATVSVTNYVCGISIRANATAVVTGNATLSDGTKTFNFMQWVAPAASGIGVTEEIFPMCYPASAVNTAWTLTSFAAGTGGNVSVAIWGYQK